ncbi:unnamed protein product, partial [Mesorhabditis belari]|uniref:Fungal lipase-type domain-containing protein n=1 Tax=Mesorhabditis belari TaxID=2138241 RepID=A0AAF3FQC4_9BILA
MGDYEVPMEVIDILFGKQLTFPGGAKVADFFYNAFLKLWNNYDVWVTGHSLGAAMAGLAAGYVVQMGYVPKEKIRLITYGEPRTGDSQYADLIDQNYQHHSTEIWYQNNMTAGLPYKTCEGDEDKSCSAGIPIYEINTFAHTTYFDIDVGIFTRRDCHYWK